MDNLNGLNFGSNVNQTQGFGFGEQQSEDIDTGAGWADVDLFGSQSKSQQ
jgi:hypothetical protein